MKIKCAVFDLDGTLLNTLTDLTEAVNYAIREMNMSAYDEKEVVDMVGNGVEKLMKRALKCEDAALVEKSVDLFSSYYAIHGSDNTKPYDGIIEMLQRLHGNGVFVGVFSNKPDFAVKRLCEIYFNNLVDFAMGTENGKAKKPDPFGVLEIMQTCGCNADNTVYVGDSDVDVDTARNAGIPCISVSWGFKTRAYLEEYGAETIVDSPKLVAEALLNKRKGLSFNKKNRQ